MSIRKKIKTDLDLAMRGKRDLELSVLRQLLAVVLNKEKEKYFQSQKAEELSEEEMLGIVSSEAKKRREAIELYLRGKREDLAEKEKKELTILEKYLPQQLSEAEVRNLVQATIEKTGAKEIGPLMACLIPQVKGRVDGSLLSKIVKEALC